MFTRTIEAFKDDFIEASIATWVIVLYVVGGCLITCLDVRTSFWGGPWRALRLVEEDAAVEHINQLLQWESRFASHRRPISLVSYSAPSSHAKAFPKIFRKSGKSEKTSRLLALPSELRQKIWAYVFCPTDFRISYVPRQVHEYIPSHNRKSCHGKGAYILAPVGPFKLTIASDDDIPRKPRQTQNPRLLGLTMSCRSLYAETIDLLYSHIHFTFSSAISAIAFIKQTPPPRLTHIRHLSIVTTLFEDPHMPQAFHKLTELLVEFPELDTLEISLVGGHGDNWTAVLASRGFVEENGGLPRTVAALRRVKTKRLVIRTHDARPFEAWGRLPEHWSVVQGQSERYVYTSWKRTTAW